MSKEELNERLSKITRVGEWSFGIGVLVLILSPLYIWVQSSQPGFSSGTLFFLIILALASAYFFTSIGNSIQHTNNLLRTKLWAVTILTLVFASGIIPLILFIFGIIGLYNAYKLNDQQLSQRVKGENKINKNNGNNKNDSPINASELPKDKLQALAELSKLKKDKIITVQEFNKLKKEILNS